MKVALVGGLLGLLALAPPVLAQTQGQVVTPAPAPQQVQPAAAPPPGAPAGQPAPLLEAAQLDQLLAPIALYPDPLLSQILMASTYPLEVVEAARWVQVSSNAALKGDALSAALAQQSWDPSVKSLVPFPQILKMMSDRLDWTQQLGDAFLAQQADVMASVQRLRHEAQAAGKLTSTPQEAVTADGPNIVIEPGDGEVYVPYYDPNAVYGEWPYPDYPPYYFPPWPGIIFAPGFSIGFGFGIGIDLIGPYWGWGRPDWGHRDIYVDPGRYSRINGGRAPGFAGDRWQHDPSHRRGVPYRSPAAAARFGGRNAATTPAAGRAERGYATPNTGARSFAQPANRGVTPGTRGFTAARPSVVRPTVQPPAFGNISRGADVRNEAQRGASSRASMPQVSAPRAAAPRAAAPRAAAPRAATPHAAAPHAAAPRGGGGKRP